MPGRVPVVNAMWDCYQRSREVSGIRGLFQLLQIFVFTEGSRKRFLEAEQQKRRLEVAGACWRFLEALERALEWWRFGVLILSASVFWRKHNGLFLSFENVLYGRTFGDPVFHIMIFVLLVFVATAC